MFSTWRCYEWTSAEVLRRNIELPQILFDQWGTMQTLLTYVTENHY